MVTDPLDGDGSTYPWPPPQSNRTTAQPTYLLAREASPKPRLQLSGPRAGGLAPELLALHGSGRGWRRLGIARRKEDVTAKQMQDKGRAADTHLTIS